jgi:dephospho-CoA kinase
MGDDQALADLNAIVHPAIQRERDRLLALARARGDRIVVSDIPLLFEAADPGEFDLIVLVDAPESVRRQRLIARRGLDSIEAERMMNSQQPALPKRAKSDFVIDNDGTLEALEAKARAVWNELERRAT